MSTPTRKRPTGSPLAVNVEPIGPHADATPEPTSPAAPSTVPQLSIPAPATPVKAPPSDVRKRSFVVPTDLMLRAQQAQKVSDILGDGYLSLNAFVCGAIENEIRRIEAAYNNGLPLGPNPGAYRRGRPASTDGI